MCMHGPNIVGGAVQMDTTLLRYASVIMEQKTCWELLHNNLQQGVQTGATCNIQRCSELLANNVASICMGLNFQILILECTAYGEQG